MPTKIILDCDPGHDDAVAMLLAWGSPEIELVGVTTVVGNQTLDKVTRNALPVARVAGIVGVPFAAGSARPLVREIETAAEIHGESGLDGPVLPEPTIQLDPRPAAQFIVDTIMAAEPGSDHARAHRRADEHRARGAARAPHHPPGQRGRADGRRRAEGNWSAVAEFNIVIDPEAAAIVFGAGWPVTMVGLDVTHQAVATPEVRAAIARVGTGPAVFVGELMEFFEKAYRDAQGFDHPPVHDPVAWRTSSTRPWCARSRLRSRSSTRRAHARDDGGRPARSGRPPTASPAVTFDLDAERFWALVVDALERIGEPEL